ncbi:MAG TPA: preprotein translocase subunit SecY [Vicinamibacterales bacterium]|nr:preprotein translocase subunit SecY [Vicinamibacterales bacterium]
MLSESLKNIFAVSDLRKRVLFTLGLLAVYRVGGHIPTPGVNSEALQLLADQAANTMFGLYDMFSGKNLSQMTIFALGIMPYISASIILQLLTVVWPYLERLSKEGELGRRKITQYTRYGTIVLSVVQALGIALYLEHQTNIAGGLPLVYSPGWGFRLMTVLTLTTGTAFIMWLGEQITERGIGNGMSLIIYAGIVVNFPHAVLSTVEQMRLGQLGLIRVLILVILMVLVVAAIIFVERGHRRVTVQYAKRVVGRRMYGGSSTHIPLKVNTGGVIPVIFASSILAFPMTMQGMTAEGSFMRRAIDQINYGMPLHNLLYLVGIIFFCYFYTAIIFNPDDVAENMRKYGGFVPGIRPGKRTAEYIDTILTRITLVGAIYLAVVALLPQFLISGFKVAPIPFIGEWLDRYIPTFITQGMGVQFYFGGTSLLIIVGVAMDTVQQVESQLIMRHYDGFMKKTRIRGRRGQ